MRVKSYLLSNLVKLYGARELGSFTKDHSSAWLVWEPGNWKPPANSTVALPKNVAAAMAGGEALAFTLPTTGTPAAIQLGRSEADIVINDGTLSRCHLIFESTAAQTWTVKDNNSRNGSTVGGTPLVGGRPVELLPDTRITAGQVALTFLAATGMFARIMQHRSPAPPPAS
jgi:hypothetical protein